MATEAGASKRRQRSTPGLISASIKLGLGHLTMRMVVLTLACACLISGCASAVRGTTEKVVINAVPTEAAIRTSLGHSCPASPCTIEVSRKTEFTAYAELQGYKPGQAYIATKVSGEGAAGMAGNILIGGVIGIGVDAISGATLDHYPNPVTITLVPEGDPGESTNIAKPPPVKPKPVGTRAGGESS